jgi:hypothetical protein
MKTLYKNELAQKMGISEGTLQHYVNHLWYEKLKEAGYYKRQKLMTKKQCAIIKELWGDFDDEL